VNHKGRCHNQVQIPQKDQIFEVDISKNVIIKEIGYTGVYKAVFIVLSKKQAHFFPQIPMSKVQNEFQDGVIVIEDGDIGGISGTDD
jgi:hypothetical protein